MNNRLPTGVGTSNNFQGIGFARNQGDTTLQKFRQTLTIANADASTNGVADIETDILEWLVKKGTSYQFNPDLNFDHTKYMVLKDSSSNAIADSSDIRIVIMDNTKQRIIADVWKGIYAQITAGDLADRMKKVVPQQLVTVGEDYRVVVKLKASVACDLTKSTVSINCSMSQYA